MNDGRDGIVNLDEGRLELAVQRAKKLRSIRPLLELPDTRAAVRAMKSHDLYAVVRRTGLFDSLEIVEVASPDQIKRCMDFDCWRRDVVNLPAVREWFSALMDVGPEKLGAVTEELDIEIPGLLLHTLADVYEIHEDSEEEPPEDDRPFFVTPDRWYELRPKNPEDEDSWRFVIQWVENLYAWSMALAQKIILESKWDTVLNMQEEAYHWRTVRINEEGFWDYHEAVGIYQYLDPRKLSVKVPESHLVLLDRNPNALVEVPHEFGDGPFAAAYAELDSSEQERVMVGVVHLMNRLMAADQISITDDRGAAEIRSRAFAMLNLGTAFLARHRSVSTVDVLRAQRVERIFQAGHSLTLELRRTALAMRELGLVSLSPETHTLLEKPWSQFYEEITARIPRMHQGIFGGNGVRPFATLEDLASAAAALEDLGLMRSLIFQGYGFDPSVLTEEGVSGLSRKNPAEISYGDIIRTMFMGFVLTGTISREPLSADMVTKWNKPGRKELEEQSSRFLKASREHLASRDFEIPARLPRMIVSHLTVLLSSPSADLYVLYRIA